MTGLDDVPDDLLRSALSRTKEAKAAKRLMIALAVKDGESVSTLSRRYGIPQSTIYYWLSRFEDRSFTEALADEPRPGRPRKLEDDERARLAADLESSPTEFGYEAAEWSPALVRDHVEEGYGVEYSLGHVRRILREGLE
ncbi:helix-turn-helix domain-containing protein [Natronorarus salvus]|uniref:helix-turn-helix domain-containing protein n=1 Tax=Natronorarus salvus TaxID=3117733 RepID=UPI002F2682A3